MADPITVQCPHCKVKLKLKAAPPAGKKVGCPKCKKPFPLKAPPKKKDEEDFLDALDDLAEDDYEAPEDEDTEEEEEAPARSTMRSRSGVSVKKGSKGKKGRSKKSSAGPILAILGGSVAALALIAGGVYLLMNLPAGAGGIRSASGEFIAFLPSDADVYFTARPADFIASPVMASLMQNPQGQKGIAEFEKAFAFPPQEVEHFFLAVKSNSNAAQPGQAGQPGQPGGPVGGNPMMGMPGFPGMPGGMGMLGSGQSNVEDVVLILRLKQPYGGKPLAQVTQAFTPKSHNGVSYYVDTKPNGGSMFFPTDRYAIITESKWIERIIDRKDQAENNTLLAYLAKDHHLTLVASPKANAAQTSLPPGLSPAIMQQSQQMQKLAQEIASVRLDVNMPGSVDLKVALTCKSDSAAQQIQAETTKQIDQFKQMAAFLKAGLPEIDSVINSVQVTQSGTTMNLSLSVPSAMIDRLKQQMGSPPGAASPTSPGAAPSGVSPGAVPQVPFSSGSTPEAAGGTDLGNSPAEVRAAVIKSHVRNQLKQVLLALHNHHDTHTNFPPAFSSDTTGKPLLSWRVHVLPYLDQKALYDQFHLNEPWDSEHNKSLIARIPPTFAAPDEPDLVQKGLTRIVVPTGMGMAFEGTQGLKVREFLDGTSRTLAAVEVASSAAVIWTKPDDLVVDLNMPHKSLTGSRGDEFLAAFTDGSVRPLKVSLAPMGLKALFTRNGNDEIPPEALQ